MSDLRRRLAACENRSERREIAELTRRIDLSRLTPAERDELSALAARIVAARGQEGLSAAERRRFGRLAAAALDAGGAE